MTTDWYPKSPFPLPEGRTVKYFTFRKEESLTKERISKVLDRERFQNPIYSRRVLFRGVEYLEFCCLQKQRAPRPWERKIK